jgi:TonB family protein
VRKRAVLACVLSVGLHALLAFLLFNVDLSTPRKIRQLPLKVVRKSKETSPQDEAKPEVKRIEPTQQEFQAPKEPRSLKETPKEVKKQAKMQPKLVEERKAKDMEKPSSDVVTGRTFHSFGIRLENTPQAQEGKGIPVQKGETLKTHPEAQQQEKQKDAKSEETTVAVATVTVMPRLLRDSKPEYPEEAKKRGVEGKVVLELIVDERGEVAFARVLKSLDPTLDAAALNAAKGLRFSPATKDGTPVSVKITYTFAFVLE